MHKPDLYPDLSPYLLVADAERTLQFIERVFGGTRLRVIDDEDGAILHAEARIGDSVVMMGQMPGAAGAHLHLYRADLDAVFDAAEAAGATLVQAPLVKDDGDLRGGFRDACGTTWWVSRQTGGAGV